MVVIGIVIFWIVNVLLEKASDRTFNYSKYIEKSNKDTNINGKSKLFKNLMNRVKVPVDKGKVIEEKLRVTLSKQSLQEFYAQKMLFPLVLVILFATLGAIQGSKLLFILAGVSTLLYFVPDFMLNQRVIYARGMRKNELPSYLTPLGLLLYTYTPYQAVKKSVNYAGPYLKPFVEQLAIEMEMYPGSSMPFENFTKKIEVNEANSFIVALQQAFETDQSRSRDIINSQIRFMRKMREQNYHTMIEKQPLKLTKFNLIPILAIGGIVFTIVITVITKVY